MQKFMNRCFYCNSRLILSHYKDIYRNHCCSKHIDTEGTVTYCSECMKLVAIHGNQLQDGRVICPDCMGMAVSPKRPYDFMLNQVVAMLHKAGFTDLDVKNITIWTATSQEMAMFKKSDVNVFNEGFCTINENGKIKIYVQSHHTKIHFAGVLAHELLHAWCFQHRLFNIPAPISEGFCNLGSYYVYHTITHGLAKIYENQLFANDDPIYGEGFKAMYAVYEEHGWNGIRNIVINSNQE